MLPATEVTLELGLVADWRFGFAAAKIAQGVERTAELKQQLSRERQQRGHSEEYDAIATTILQHGVRWHPTFKLKRAAAHTCTPTLPPVFFRSWYVFFAYSSSSFLLTFLAVVMMMVIRLSSLLALNA